MFNKTEREGESGDQSERDIEVGQISRICLAERKVDIGNCAIQGNVFVRSGSKW